MIPSVRLHSGCVLFSTAARVAAKRLRDLAHASRMKSGEQKSVNSTRPCASGAAAGSRNSVGLCGAGIDRTCVVVAVVTVSGAVGTRCFRR